MSRLFLILSGINGFLAVALGAFGAHGLKGRLADVANAAQRLEWWHTGAQYHLAHALALTAVAYLLDKTQATALATTAGFAFAVGILIFSGSLYAMTLTGITRLGAITPLGGLSLLCGWACMTIAAFRT